MVINARPRYVSHGFEAFVPFQRVESLHQKLVEMTNNDVNAWNFFKPSNSPRNSWDDHHEALNDENFALHNLYPAYCQNTVSMRQPHAINTEKPHVCPTEYQSHSNDYNMTLNTLSIHHGQPTGLNCLEKRSPMLANGYSHGYLGQRHGSFAEFSNTNHGMKLFANQNPNESDLTRFAAAPPLSYREDVLMIGEASPGTTYNSYSTSNGTVDPVSLVQSSAHNSQDSLLKGIWWPENLRGGQNQCQDNYGLDMLHDGLPRSQKEPQRQFSGLWVTANGFSHGWPSQDKVLSVAQAPITISPKALTLSVPAPSISSSESSRPMMLPLSDSSPVSSSISSSRQDTPESISEALQVVEPAPVRPNRQTLPHSLPQPLVAPVLPSSDRSSRNSTRKLSLETNSEGPSFPKATLPLGSKLRLLSTQQKGASTSATSLKPKKIEPKPSNGTSYSSPMTQAAHRRNEKDDFLVKHKLAGMSYKDIRRLGNFTEAESTLRGRFRTLTKHKTARVRKPEWTDNDIKLLKKAVRKLTSGSDLAKGKVPWKLVAEYIANNGGSYHFGNATCRKRWDDLSP